jgi:hypothetical protein
VIAENGVVAEPEVLAETGAVAAADMLAEPDAVGADDVLAEPDAVGAYDDFVAVEPVATADVDLRDFLPPSRKPFFIDCELDMENGGIQMSV